MNDPPTDPTDDESSRTDEHPGEGSNGDEESPDADGESPDTEDEPPDTENESPNQESLDSDGVPVDADESPNQESLEEEQYSDDIKQDPSEGMGTDTEHHDADRESPEHSDAAEGSVDTTGNTESERSERVGGDTPDRSKTEIGSIFSNADTGASTAPTDDPPYDGTGRSGRTINRTRPDDPQGPDSSRLRFRSLLDRRLSVVLLVLVVVLAAGGWLTYGGYADDQIDTEQRMVADGELATELEYVSTVERENEVYDVGTELPNRGVYYTRITPTLEGEHTIRPETDGFANESVTVEHEVGIRALQGDGQEAETVWQESLDHDRVEASNPDDEMVVQFSVNVSKVTERIRNIEESLGAGLGTVELYTTAEARYEGTADGQRETMDAETELGIDPGQNTYGIATAETSTDETIVTAPTTVETTPSPLYRFGGPILLIIGLVGLVGLSIARYYETISLDQSETAWLEYRSDYDEFDEWITVAEPPADLRDRELGTAGSLEDLVDIGIDTDSAVIYDPETEQYYVLHPTGGYVYAPPPPPPSNS